MRILLIDGNSIVNRAFYGVPSLTNKDGFHTNAIYGFLNIILKIYDETEPTHMMVAFDEKAPTFRHKMFDEYKGTRKPMPEELKEQIPVLKEVLAAMNIKIFSKPGIEADDILGTMAKLSEKKDYEVIVLSGDRDLLQLASEKICIKIPKTKGGKTIVEDYYPSQVIEKYNVTPLQIIDLKGLMGDSSDNIPGVPGVGEKTATKLLTLYGTVENTIANIENISQKRTRELIKNNVELAKLSKKLATIKLDCNLDFTPDQCEIKDLFNEKAYEKLKSLDIKSILKRFDTNYSNDSKLEKNFLLIKNKKEWIEFLKGIEKKSHFGIKAIYRNKGTAPREQKGQMTLFSEIEQERLIGIALAFSDSQIGFALVSESFSQEEVLSEIRKLYKKHVLVANDLKSELDFYQELELENCFDTNVAAYLISPNDKDFNEEYIADRYCQIAIPSFEQNFGKKSLEEAFNKDNDLLIKYASYCAYVNYLSYKNIKKELKKNGETKLFEEIEMPLVFTLHYMEKWGIMVDKQALLNYGNELAKEIEKLEETIYEQAGEVFNINSTKQLGNILFEKMRMPYGKKTKTGYSTSAEVLEKLRFEDPIIENILDYRQLTKLKSTYVDGLNGYIGKDNKIHTNFNQTIAATGRLSSTEPNLQNIPIRMEQGKLIRKVFVPEEGYVFLDADYSQIELRVLAHMSNDENLIKAYVDNADIHRSTASLVFHTPYEEVTDLQRRNAKAVNFGIVYGISGFGLAKDLNISQKEANEYIENYFKTYPKVKEYMDNMVSEGKEKGYVLSMYGRKRPIPELKMKNFMQRQFGERIAMNSPIQGTAADIIKIAMNRVYKRLMDGNYKSRLILQIHDELIIETHKDEIKEISDILHDEMINAAQLNVPLVAEVKEGENWYDAH